MHVCAHRLKCVLNSFAHTHIIWTYAIHSYISIHVVLIWVKYNSTEARLRHRVIITTTLITTTTTKITTKEKAETKARVCIHIYLCCTRLTGQLIRTLLRLISFPAHSPPFPAAPLPTRADCSAFRLCCLCVYAEVCSSDWNCCCHCCCPPLLCSYCRAAALRRRFSCASMPGQLLYWLLLLL